MSGFSFSLIISFVSLANNNLPKILFFYAFALCYLSLLLFFLLLLLAIRFFFSVCSLQFTRITWKENEIKLSISFFCLNVRSTERRDTA